MVLAELPAPFASRAASRLRMPSLLSESLAIFILFFHGCLDFCLTLLHCLAQLPDDFLHVRTVLSQKTFRLFRQQPLQGHDVDQNVLTLLPPLRAPWVVSIFHLSFLAPVFPRSIWEPWSFAPLPSLKKFTPVDLLALVVQRASPRQPPAALRVDGPQGAMSRSAKKDKGVSTAKNPVCTRLA